MHLRNLLSKSISFYNPDVGLFPLHQQHLDSSALQHLAPHSGAFRCPSETESNFSNQTQL